MLPIFVGLRTCDTQAYAASVDTYSLDIHTLALIIVKKENARVYFIPCRPVSHLWWILIVSWVLVSSCSCKHFDSTGRQSISYHTTPLYCKCIRICETPSSICCVIPCEMRCSQFSRFVFSSKYISLRAHDIKSMRNDYISFLVSFFSFIVCV